MLRDWPVSGGFLWGFLWGDSVLLADICGGLSSALCVVGIGWEGGECPYVLGPAVAFCPDDSQLIASLGSGNSSTGPGSRVRRVGMWMQVCGFGFAVWWRD